MKYYRVTLLCLVMASNWMLANDAMAMNKCVQPDGRVEFTDQPCPSDAHSAVVEKNGRPQQSQQSSQASPAQMTSGTPGRGLSAEDRMKSCDPGMALAAATEAVSSPDNLKEPLQLFTPAFVYFQNGRKDEGVFWFYAAQLRARQQMVVKNGDRGQLLAIMMMTMGPVINNYAFQNTVNLTQILDKVLKWDKDTPNPFRDEAKLQKLDSKIEQIYAGFNELKSKLVIDNVSMEAAARQAAPGIEQMYARMNSERCRNGQPDPAYANQITESEWLKAADFVKSNKEVMREVGTIKGVGRVAGTMKHGETIPSRYELSVGGDRSAYAIVDVSRSSGEARFTLACLAHLSLGQRDPFKDVCKQ